jgi:hypothetical protein
MSKGHEERLNAASAGTVTDAESRYEVLNLKLFKHQGNERGRYAQMPGDGVED